MAQSDLSPFASQRLNEPPLQLLECVNALLDKWHFLFSYVKFVLRYRILVPMGKLFLIRFYTHTTLHAFVWYSWYSIKRSMYVHINRYCYLNVGIAHAPVVSRASYLIFIYFEIGSEVGRDRGSDSMSPSDT